jgi:predicted CXXCH cytochrome family protein
MRRQYLTQLLGTLVVATAIVSLPTIALAGIETSKHDFSLLAWDTEICNACHTPHQADTDVSDAPLWDHEVRAGSGFTPYPSGAGTTMDTVPGQPSGISLLCLSCHDGVTAMDNFGGVTTGTAVMAATAAGYVGLDLANDHPISMSYTDGIAGTDGQLWPPTSTASGLGANIDDDMLFGASNDQVECASCHDPHSTAFASFLRVDNAASALCLTCHNK